MTDLISALADQLVALNNASPRLPSKQQIEEVLRPQLRQNAEAIINMSIDNLALGSYWGHDQEGYRKYMAAVCKRIMNMAEYYRAYAEPAGDLNEASLEAAIGQIQGFKTEAELKAQAPDIKHVMLPLPYKDPSPEMMQLMDMTRLESISKDMLSAINEDNDARDQWDAQERAAHKLLGHNGPTTKERREARREANEIYWANKLNEPMPRRYAVDARGDYDTANPDNYRCPGSTDGSHSWQQVVGTADSDWNVLIGDELWRCPCGAKKVTQSAKWGTDLDAVAKYRTEAERAAALETTAADFERTAREHTTAAWNRLTPIQRTLCQCPGYASGEHHWEVDPWSTRETRPDEIAARCVCGAVKP